MEALINLVFQLDNAVIYTIIALLVCAEAAAFIGLFVPGELSLLAGGALAATGRLSVATLVVVGIIAAVVGDIIGYELGRKVGTRMLTWEPVRRRTQHQLPGMTGYLATRGSWVVIIGRWTSIMRAIVPALAGMTRMPFGKFLVANVIGGVTWVTAVSFAGFLAGASYRQVDHLLGRWSPMFAILVLTLLFLSFRRWKAWSERVSGHSGLARWVPPSGGESPDEEAPDAGRSGGKPAEGSWSGVPGVKHQRG